MTAEGWPVQTGQTLDPTVGLAHSRPLSYTEQNVFMPHRKSTKTAARSSASLGFEAKLWLTAASESEKTRRSVDPSTLLARAA